MKDLPLISSLFAACSATAAIVFSVETNHPDALYRCGEAARFTVTAKDDAGAPLAGTFTARLDNFGPQVIATTEVDLAKTNAFTLVGTLAEPGFLRVHIDGAGAPAERRPLDYSVGFEPGRIKPAAPAPRDFLSFWLAAQDKLNAEVPLDPQMQRVPEKSTDAYDYYRISFATFGRRIHPVTGQELVCDHVVIAAQKDILAACGGVVTEVAFDPEYGNTVTIDHGDGMKTAYGHLKEAAVVAGDTVDGGQVIGTAGRTGMATGDCLAFWVYADGQPADPMAYYPQLTAAE